MGTGTVRVSDAAGEFLDVLVPIATPSGILASNGAWPWADQTEAHALVNVAKWGSDNEWASVDLDDNGYPMSLAGSDFGCTCDRSASYLPSA